MFDTSKLASRVFSVAKAGKFSAPFVDTLRFPTRSANKQLTEALDFLFNEVAEAAEVLGVDLTTTGGTFKVDYKKQALYSPVIRAHQGQAVIEWGKAMVPIAPIVADKDNRYVSIRENGKGFELTVVYNNKQTAVPLFTKKGKSYTKSVLMQKLLAGQLADALAPAIVYCEPLLSLRKLQKDGEKPVTLYVKSLTVQSGGQYGTTGVIEFYGLKTPYKANQKAVERLLSSQYGEDKEQFTWAEGDMEFTIKGVSSGVINSQATEWLDYTVLDRSVSVEDFEYTEGDEEELELPVSADDDEGGDAEVFDYPVDDE